MTANSAKTGRAPIASGAGIVGLIWMAATRLAWRNGYGRDWMRQFITEL